MTAFMGCAVPVTHIVSVPLLLFLLLLGAPVSSLPRTIRLGGLFDFDATEQKLVFQVAVDKVNQDDSVLPDSHLVLHQETNEPDDSFDISKKVCRLLRMGVAGLFGPASSVPAQHVRSVSDAFEVPHVEARWDHALQRDDLSINVYPRASALNRAYIDVVKRWGWTSFLIVYQENEGIVRMQDFLKETLNAGWEIRVQQFNPDKPFRYLFQEIRTSFAKQPDKDICILLDVSPQHLHNVLKQAQQVEMMTVRNKYIITSLDLYTTDLEDFQYSRANITGFRIVNAESEEYGELLNETNYRIRRVNGTQITAISTASAMVFDAVSLFSRALQDLDNGKRVDAFPSISCEENTKGTDGTSLINYMKSNKIRGLTGQVHFDGQGFRSSFTLDILQLSNTGLKKIGTVFPGQDINITEVIAPEVVPESGYENKKFIITTILNKPFVMLKISPKKMQGNDRYEGFTLDLIEELSKQLKFSFEIREVADNMYGAEIDAKKKIWNGMIGEVLTGVADMAIADVTITSKRETVMDFTMPFMNTGISILFKKPTEKVKSLFSFLSPFSYEVWTLVMAALLFVSSLLFLVGRMSPYEWENDNPCRQDDTTEENWFTFLNSMWFAFASLMQQGCEAAPRSSSTRTVSGIWYFFTLIMISSYTANLAAFLTVEKVVYPIEDAAGLSRQTKIQYGCLKSGSTRLFFENSKKPMYQKMWEYMKSHPEVFVDSNENGKERVYQGNYAYLMESASIEFLTERECNLTQIGGLLDHKGYGIATKKSNGSHPSLSSWLNGGILQLQERGILHTLKERWWKQKRGGGTCVEAPQGSVTELGLSNVGGVFVVLLAGILLGAAVAAVEFFWQFRKYAGAQGEMGKLMAKDIKFALTCSSSTKELPRIVPKKGENSGSSVHGSR